MRTYLQIRQQKKTQPSKWDRSNQQTKCQKISVNGSSPLTFLVHPPLLDLMTLCINSTKRKVGLQTQDVTSNLYLVEKKLSSGFKIFSTFSIIIKRVMPVFFILAQTLLFFTVKLNWHLHTLLTYLLTVCEIEFEIVVVCLFV